MLNRFKFILLSVLESEKADSVLKAISCYEIQDKIYELGYTVNYINQTLNKFQKDGLVKRGLNNRRSITFYITNKGKEKLSEIRGESYEY